MLPYVAAASFNEVNPLLLRQVLVNHFSRQDHRLRRRALCEPLFPGAGATTVTEKLRLYLLFQ
jgi:hypothetical protein